MYLYSVHRHPIRVNGGREMNAKQLIEVAAKNGYAVGRNRSGEYRYAKNVNGVHTEYVFTGGWHQFVRFMNSLFIQSC